MAVASAGPYANLYHDPDTTMSASHHSREQMLTKFQGANVPGSESSATGTFTVIMPKVVACRFRNVFSYQRAYQFILIFL